MRAAAEKGFHRDSLNAVALFNPNFLQILQSCFRLSLITFAVIMFDQFRLRVFSFFTFFYSVIINTTQ